MHKVAIIILASCILMTVNCTRNIRQKEEEKKHYSSSYTLSYEVCDSSTTGTIKGNVIKASNGEPIKFMNLILKGTSIGAMTDIYGDYLLRQIPPDTYTVSTWGMGYENIQADIEIKASQIIIINFALAKEKTNYELKKKKTCIWLWF